MSVFGLGLLFTRILPFLISTCRSHRVIARSGGGGAYVEYKTTSSSFSQTAQRMNPGVESLKSEFAVWSVGASGWIENGKKK